ncbi:MAG: PilZ domain-containing protein [Candidatus Brocadiia bacterium]
MAQLVPQARQSATRGLELCDAAVERGDLAGTIAGALLEGRLLAFLADAPHAPVAQALADALRRRFPHDHWPPALVVDPQTPSLALYGIEFGVPDPLTRKAETLLREGDVALLVAGAEPSGDLAAAAAAAAAQGARVAALGLPACGLEAEPAIELPQAPAGVLVLAQALLASALSEALASQLPQEPPAGLEPALAAFPCTNCQAPLAAPPHLAGRLGVCPACYNNTVLAPHLPRGEHEKRAFLRFALRHCALRVELAPDGKAPLQLPGQVSLDNLSPGGLRFTLLEPSVELQPDDRLRVHIDTPAFHKTLSLEARVKRVTREDRRHRVGAVFVDCPPATAERLRILERNLVLRHLTPRAAATPEPS